MPSMPKGEIVGNIVIDGKGDRQGERKRRTNNMAKDTDKEKCKEEPAIRQRRQAR